jgi:hypothetical protein
MLPLKLNEVYMAVEEDIDDKRPLYEQCMIQVDLKDVAKLRSIVFTHEYFPGRSYCDHTFLSSDKLSREDYKA